MTRSNKIAIHSKNVQKTEQTLTFPEAEMKVLGKGLKYNLHYRHKDWIKLLAIEADTAISKMHIKDQMYMNQIVANNI